MSDLSVPHKQCSRCKKSLPLICFTKNRNRADGLKVWCVKCCAEYHGRVWHPQCVADGFQGCSKCGEWFPLTSEYWHKNSSNKTGLSNTCKSCAKLKAKQWLEDNPERAAEYHKNYAKEHSAEATARMKKWTEDNPERAAALYRAIHKRNINDPIKHEKMKQASREWGKKNPIKVKIRTHKRRARILNAEGTFTNADIDRIFDEQEGRCRYCGITLFRDIPGDMHIDHIQPLSRGGSNWPDNLACTCEACNLSKNDKTLAEWMDTRGW